MNRRAAHSNGQVQPDNVGSEIDATLISSSSSPSRVNAANKRREMSHDSNTKNLQLVFETGITGVTKFSRAFHILFSVHSNRLLIGLRELSNGIFLGPFCTPRLEDLGFSQAR